MSFDLTDLDNFAQGFPHGLFEEHRRVAPVAWPEPTEHTPDGERYAHLAFGHGAHFCLGAHLARLEMSVVFEELMARADHLELAGEVEWTRSNRHTGVRRLPLRMSVRR